MKEQDTRSEQALLWNGSAGQAWADLQKLLDRMYQAFEPRMAAAVRKTDRQVLDVGCGAGATTLALARRLGARGGCLGVDISRPLIALARERAARAAPGEAGQTAHADFVCADAGCHPFAPHSVDLVVSRFGVMFFDDPVAAFANLRRATRPGGRLDAIVWRGPDANPFMTAAERAAQGLLPALPARDLDAPGQFAFARRERIDSILAGSGWQCADIEAVDVGCSFPAHALPRYLGRMGPVGRLLEGMEEPARATLMPTLCKAFDPWLRGDELRFVAACWRVRATA